MAKEKEVIKIRKKILFGITSLGLGGAERVLVDISNKLVEKYDITIFSIYDHGELQKELNPKIKFKALYDSNYKELNSIQRMWSPIRILLFSRLLYKKYIKDNFDVEIAFLEGPITRLFSTKDEETKKIAWIHNDIKHVFGNGLKSKLKKLIDSKIYHRYNNLVFVSKDNMKSFQEAYKNFDESKMRVIYNYINSNLVIEKSNGFIPLEFEESKGVKLVSVCRLVEQKAIDRFIKVHKRLIESGYQHQVYIIGDGPEMAKLKESVNIENVSNTFKLLGKRENPYPYIKYADYFCLLSYFEGYGMVLEEAKILNKNIIITDTAAREAIEGYNNAIVLKNDEKRVYEGLRDIFLSKYNLENKENFSYDNIENINRIVELIEK